MNWTTLIDPEFSGRLCMTLLHSLWQVALLALAAWGLDRLWRRRSVERSYALHVAALLAGMAAAPITYALVEVGTPTTVARGDSPVEPGSSTQPPVVTALPQTSPTVDELEQAPNTGGLPSVADTGASVPVTTAMQESSTVWRRVAPWIVALYAVGVLVMLARLMAGFWQAHRLGSRAQLVAGGALVDSLNALARKWSMRVVPALAQAEQIAVPKVVGFARPTILIPASAITGLSTDELEMILAHELAHVRRYDMWVTLLQRLAEAVLFFNPALWYLSRRISMLREYCCDELTCRAMSKSGAEPRTRYASALLRVVELNKQSHTNRGVSPAFDESNVAALAASGRSPSELRRRVARLFGEPLREPVRLSRGGVIAVLALTAALFVGPVAWTTIAAPKTDQQRSSDAVTPEEFPEAPAPGRIADAQGRGIANATVKQINSSWTATTDAEGRFPLPKLKPREGTRLTVSAAGFLPVDDGVGLVPSRDGKYIVSGGWPIQLARPTTLSGRVLGPDGKPLAGAPLSITIWVHFPQNNCVSNYQKTITDEQGRFTMKRIPPGSHVIYYPGESPRSIPAKGVYGALVVEPTDGQQLSDFVLDLSQSTASVEGRVFGPDGKPMVGARVHMARFRKWEGTSGGTGPNPPAPTTDEQGRYKLTGIGPGQWTLGPFHPRFQRASPRQVVTLVSGQTAHQDLRVTERNEPETDRTRAADEAERTDDLRKLRRSLHAIGGLPPVDRNLATFGTLIFLHLSPNQTSSSRVRVKRLGLPPTATPEQVARAAHAGELYFVAPDSLVTVNGTIVAPLTLPPNRRNGSRPFVDWIWQMTRAELVEQVEASRRQNPDADGRRITIHKGENYIVVRSDGQGYLMHIDGVSEGGAGLAFLYLGHLRLEQGSGADSAAAPTANTTEDDASAPVEDASKNEQKPAAEKSSPDRTRPDDGETKEDGVKTIQGKVHDEAGNRLADADIWLSVYCESYRFRARVQHVKSDSQGRFTLEITRLGLPKRFRIHPRRFGPMQQGISWASSTVTGYRDFHLEATRPLW